MKTQYPQVTALLPAYCKGRKAVTLREAAALCEMSTGRVEDSIAAGDFEGHRQGMGRWFVDYESLMRFLGELPPKGDDA